MEYFHTIKDSDIFDNPLPEPESYIDRPTVKGLVFDKDNKIALICHPTENYGFLPGGGIEQEETPEEAFVRECMEELGCDIEIISEIGTTLQLRAKDSRKFETRFYVAKVVGEKGIPTTTQEDELDVKIKWFTEEELNKQLEEQTRFKSPDWYIRQFNSHTHFAALQKYLEDKN